jgi:hypothetical protein
MTLLPSRLVSVTHWTCIREVTCRITAGIPSILLKTIYSFPIRVSGAITVPLPARIECLSVCLQDMNMTPYGFFLLVGRYWVPRYLFKSLGIYLSPWYCGHFGLLYKPWWWMRMILEQLVEWNLAGETEVLGENLPQRHFVHPTPYGYVHFANDEQKADGFRKHAKERKGK